MILVCAVLAARSPFHTSSSTWICIPTGLTMPPRPCILRPAPYTLRLLPSALCPKPYAAPTTYVLEYEVLTCMRLLHGSSYASMPHCLSMHPCNTQERDLSRSIRMRSKTTQSSGEARRSGKYLGANLKHTKTLNLKLDCTLSPEMQA